MKALSKSTAASIIGYVALTLILTAGAAQSLAGTNTVDSGDIVDGTITTPDLKTGALSGSKILDNSVTGRDVNESTLKPRVLTTSVSSAGVKLLGSGTASRSSLGQYDVDYGFAMTGCMAQATVGYNFGTNNPGGAHTAGSAMTQVGVNNAVHVIVTANGSVVDSAFFLTLVCP